MQFETASSIPPRSYVSATLKLDNTQIGYDNAQYGYVQKSRFGEVKIRDIVGYLIEIESIDEVLTLTKYKPHRLTGDRAGYFALSVTPNWRITFGHDADDNEIIDLDYEDYH